MKRCPNCDGPMSRAIYLGFPLWLCEDGDDCGTADGLFARLPFFLPIPVHDAYGEPYFTFLRYTGAYLPALWYWLLHGNIS